MKIKSIYIACYPWVISLRLRTLPLALSAILIGNSLAYLQHDFSLGIFLLSLITASLLQILSNLANDYGDAIKGSDDLNRIGPSRGIQRGLITLNQLRCALWINILLCVCLGITLLIIACNTIHELLIFLGLGLFSILAAITYTVGKKPYGYCGLGDLSVLIFFGLVSVIGSYYLQTKSLTWLLMLPAIGCGLLAVAVLNINNLRDRQNDIVNHKRTLIVMMGQKNGQYYHTALLAVSLLSFCCFTYFHLHTAFGWLFIAVVPLFLRHILAVFKIKTAKDAAPLLLQMVKLALLTNLLYCLGIILS